MNSKQQGQRVHIDLSLGWEFLRGRVRGGWLGGEGAAAERVDLPHCWNRRDTFESETVYYQGDGAYRLAFDFSIEDAAAYTWHVRSEGFYGTGDVWLNGEKLAGVDGQYLGFSVPLINPPKAGHNLLGVRLENRAHRNVLPGNPMPDFLLYGGLAGRVWLEGLPRAHFIERETWVSCDAVSATEAQVQIPFAVQGAGSTSRSDVATAAGKALEEGQPLRMRWRILEAEGNLVAEREQMLGAARAVAHLRLPSPRRWSVDEPILYQAVGELWDGDRLVDTCRVRFGCRTAEFRAGEGFFLNGSRCELHGCNRHESMPGFGNALPESLHRADAQLLKRHGCNFVRLSHYPQHPAFLDACDEFGLLVYAEIATWKVVRRGGWLRAAERQLRGMIGRDRHHPSVILWGMGNEGRDRGAYGRLRDVARELDPTRPTIYAENHLYRARRKRTLGIPDVWGCNYELDAVEAGARAARLGSVVISECSNYPPAVRGTCDEEAEQVALILRDLAQFRQKPVVAGFALWCWADYATLRKQRFARHCGIVDAWRLPKMGAALMEVLFCAEPVVYVRGDWSMAGPAVRAMHVFSNCARVELRVGKQVIQTLEGGPWWRVDVPFSEQPLTGESRRDGKVAADTLRPHGLAHRLILEEEEIAGEPVGARLAGGSPSRGPDGPIRDVNPRGLLIARVRVVDAVGVWVANWTGWASVVVNGGARVMAHTADDRVPLAGGEGRVFVMLGKNGGKDPRRATPRLQGEAESGGEPAGPAGSRGGEIAIRVDADGLVGAVWAERSGN